MSGHKGDRIAFSWQESGSPVLAARLPTSEGLERAEGETAATPSPSIRHANLSARGGALVTG